MSLRTHIPSALALLALLVPGTVQAAKLSVTKPSHIQQQATKDAINSSSAHWMSASSASGTHTIISYDMGVSFKVPKTWTDLYQWDNELSAKLRKDAVPDDEQSIIAVVGDKSGKERTTCDLYKWFLKRATLEETSDTIAVDYYVPSFHMTASGTVKIAGKDGLWVTYSGAVASTRFSYKRVIFLGDTHLYSFLYRALPETYATDLPTFDAAAATLKLPKNSSSSSSAKSSARPRRGGSW